MKRMLLTACVFVLVGCMAMPALARGGRGGGGGGRGGYGYGGYGGYGYGRGYGGYGLGYGGYGYGGYGLGYGGYGGGAYLDDSASYAPAPNYYPAAPVPQVPQMPAPSSAPATLAVIVPNAQAQVWVDGAQTTSKGMERVFQTPPLDPGSSYTYHLRVTWTQGSQPMTVDRQVQVTPGSRTIIDLNNPATTTSAPADVLAR